MAVPLADQSEILFRQVHPDLFRSGRPSSSAFTPTKCDMGELSVALSSLTTPEGAFLTHVSVHGLKSCGTWAVTVQECTALSLRAFHSPIDAPSDPAHGHIDFSSLTSRTQVEKTGMLLSRNAIERGCLYAPAAK